MKIRRCRVVLNIFSIDVAAVNSCASPRFLYVSWACWPSSFPKRGFSLSYCAASLLLAKHNLFLFMFTDQHNSLAQQMSMPFFNFSIHTSI